MFNGTAATKAIVCQTQGKLKAILKRPIVGSAIKTMGNECLTLQDTGLLRPPEIFNRCSANLQANVIEMKTN